MTDMRFLPAKEFFSPKKETDIYANHYQELLK